MAWLSREKEKQFFTFINIANDDFDCWIEDPRLKLNMDRKQSILEWETEPSFPVNSWVLYWHQDWESKHNKLPRYHLHAYLQESCYWSAKKISSRFSTTNFDFGDCFQTAFEKSDKVLKGFKPDLGISLATYAGRAFSNTIQDALSQHNEIQIASELSLLKRCTGKRLGQALSTAGLPPQMQELHKAAWQSFTAFYFPQDTAARNLASLTEGDWAQIMARYEVLREREDLMEASQALLQKWLGDCVLYLRNHTAPQSVSLNAAMENSEEFIEQLGDTREEAMALLLAHELDQKQQQQQQQIAAVLQNGLSNLEPFNQQLLQLYYGEQLKQKEIAARLHSKQYKVSRQLRAARQALLKVLVTWGREELHISFDATVLNSMTVILEDWLKAQFSGERNTHVDV